MEPIPFIFSDFTINEDVIKLLEADTMPFTVVSVVGPYRTGKSYLLNRIMGRRDGFSLGPTVEAKTKGIWFWLGDFFGNPERALILLDTEGLHDTQQTDNAHDMNIFILTVLLSSVFIYNTKGTIDSKSLDGLHLASEMSQFISSNSTDQNLEEGQNLGQHFPLFIWAVRDHHLKLEIDGKIVTANEYLDHCLKTKKGFSPQVYQYNAIRDAIRNFFPQRECQVFPVPVTNPDLMNNLDTLNDNELSQSFI